MPPHIVNFITEDSKVNLERGGNISEEISVAFNWFGISKSAD